MSDVTVTRIPIPQVILKGDWYGIVYAIDTEGKTLEEHNAIVDERINSIIDDFNNNSHYTVSMRRVRQQLVYQGEDVQRYCTLVQLRIRDSY
jgi:hypothetical protein